MPYSGKVGQTYDSSYYTFTTSATTQTITLTNLTAAVDVEVYTDAAFTTKSSNWTCSTNLGTTADGCTAGTPAPAGTTLYIKAVNYATTTGATFTLGITTTTSLSGSEGAAGAPLTITMPHNGQVDAMVGASYYTHTATGTIQTITITATNNLTSVIDLRVYTDANFNTWNPNWTCTTSSGVGEDSCTATTPVPAGTVLYIKATSYFLGTGATTFTLDTTTTSTSGSEGAAGTPLAISMPHNGQVAVPTLASFNDSYYSYTTVGTVGTINLNNLTDDVDVTVSTDATFNFISSNWTCTYNSGTTSDSCTATAAVPAGTVLYIQVWNMTSAGGTFTLSVAP
jgi:hypothetical protein